MSLRPPVRAERDWGEEMGRTGPWGEREQEEEEKCEHACVHTYTLTNTVRGVTGREL